MYPGWTYTTVLCHLLPNRDSRDWKFFNSLMKMMLVYIIRMLSLKKAIKSPGPNYPRLCILLLHVPLNTHTYVLLLRNSVLRKAKKRLKSMLIFWPREWRKSKNAGNRLPREVDCPSWELPSKPESRKETMITTHFFQKKLKDA